MSNNAKIYQLYGVDTAMHLLRANARYTSTFTAPTSALKDK